MPVLRVFFCHLKKYRWSVLFIVLSTILTETVFTVGVPYIAKLLFDGLANSVPGSAAHETLKPTLLLFIGANFLVFLNNRALMYTFVTLQPRIMADLEQSSFTYLLGHSYQFFQNNFSGSLVRRVTRIAKAFEEIMDTTQQKLLPILIAFIGILIVLFRRSWLVGTIVLIWILAMATYNYLYSRWKVRNDVERAEQDSRCVGFLSDALSNVLTIKLFSAGKREVATFERESGRLRELRLRSWIAHTRNYGMQALILIAMQGGVLWLALTYWSEGKLSAGDVVLFQSYFTILYSKVLDFARMIRQYYSAFADATEMVEILDQSYEVKDAPKAKALRVPKGAVTFNEVDFSYGTASVLKGFDLAIQPGEKIALVGSSGAGKSTIVKLLFRFYDVTKGSIQIDGQDLMSVTQDSLRSHIALVPQEPILFHRSLLENIRYGSPGATEKDVIKAAKLAHCHEFIQKLPQGYDTFVGERGVKLSGGERQRVAIARAILKDAPILVLDEATSSLDSESEGMIQDALHTLMKNKTTIVIAHRLSTIMSMDRIVIMDRGRVVDVGTHADLVEQEGLYKKLWNLQVGGFFSGV
jgi:ATP-binding cassette subfamily B protein